MTSLVGAVAIGLVLYWCFADSSRTTHHVHGAFPKDAARHEGGHGAVARHVGGTVGRGWIDREGSGAIDADAPRSASPAHHIAVCLGGALAEGSGIDSSQCRGDRANIAAILRKVPRGDRRSVMADAGRIAAAGLRAESSTARRIENALLDRGRS